MADRHLQPLALTPGEPAGIGAEIALKAWRRQDTPSFFLIDDPERVARLSRTTGLNVPVAPITRIEESASAWDRGLPVYPWTFPGRLIAGRPDPENAEAVIGAIRHAVERVSAGQAAAVVTNPIQKSCLYQAGFPYPGHTEFVAALTGAPRPVMMLACAALRVVPVTVHEAIRNVPGQLTCDLIVETCRITARALVTDFALARPRIAVSGLNPHAGEAGTLGSEDDRIIAPALSMLRDEGYAVTGPHAADSMFHAAARAGYDVAVCMYHDQALIPVKTLDFAGTVNVTLGLPIVRTSPDHGTALDRAGTGLADETSLVQALKLAGAMSARREASRS